MRKPNPNDLQDHISAFERMRVAIIGDPSNIGRALDVWEKGMLSIIQEKAPHLESDFVRNVKGLYQQPGEPSPILLVNEAQIGFKQRRLDCLKQVDGIIRQLKSLGQ